MSRAVERLEFWPDGAEPVLAAMDRLSGAADGWVNLLPGLAGDVERTTAGPFLFGRRQPDVTMATWMPAGRRRFGGRTDPEMTLGIMHPQGRHAVARLGSAGLPLPPGWRVRQDHQRRGLLLSVPADAAHGDVLAWTLRAAAELCPEPMTGRWQAVVYEPIVAHR